MTAKEKPRIPLPKDWTGNVRSAVLHVISLAQYATAYTRSWAANSPNERMRLKTENDRLESEVALLKEEIRIKDARLLSFGILASARSIRRPNGWRFWNYALQCYEPEHLGLSARVLAPLHPLNCDVMVADSSHADESPGPRSERGALRSQNCQTLSSKQAQLEISVNGSHVLPDAPRFDCNRDCLAATRLASKSWGTLSPVPKYISSGVCPRNAECGSFLLYSST